MHIALYRKYRPAFFADVVGRNTLPTLCRARWQRAIRPMPICLPVAAAPAKTTCAKILAKALNCKDPRNGDPCGECEVCRGIDDGSVLDVLEIDAASNNGVDNIRDLRDEANFTPAVGRYRVYIIDEAHMLSPVPSMPCSRSWRSRRLM